jgi:hypothetical protein
MTLNEFYKKINPLLNEMYEKGLPIIVIIRDSRITFLGSNIKKDSEIVGILGELFLKICSTESSHI